MLSLATHAVLHRFAGREADWAGYVDDLTDAQVTRLAAPPPAGPADPDLLQPSDAPVLAALAKQAGWTEGRVIRRVEALREAGILYFDVDLASTAMGFKAPAYLWLIVEPARLATVGEEIARHAEVPFAAAITGSANLVASVVCRDSEALYEYVTTKISAAAGVRQLEISPVLSRIKQAGSLMDGPRLATPRVATSRPP